MNDLSVKTVRNLYVHLNAIFEFAIRKRWCHVNPCRLVDKPRAGSEDDAEIRFLDQAELDALLAAPAPRRHGKRAARARALRDQERLQWKAIGDALGCSPATAMYLYRATAGIAGDEERWRVDLGDVKHDGGDDGAATGRAARPPLARRRLGGQEDPGQRGDEERQAAISQIRDFSTGCADGGQGRRRAGPAV